MMTDSSRPEHSSHPISQPLRAAIAARGLTASALARAAGVDPGIVKRYLEGRRGLTLATADKLAAALDLQLTHFAEAEHIGAARPCGRATGDGDPRTTA